ncbi:unnamed protein product [Mytilus edulis]|uniref:Uncharacterized protein n=1 Tax=Mytilus edulis TaxID=6550 RepID=A0A8S3TWF5_MYTED|nr:unnamed protein product [Mytilus edulis]
MYKIAWMVEISSKALATLENNRYNTTQLLHCHQGYDTISFPIPQLLVETEPESENEQLTTRPLLEPENQQNRGQSTQHFTSLVPNFGFLRLAGFSSSFHEPPAASSLSHHEPPAVSHHEPPAAPSASFHHHQLPIVDLMLYMLAHQLYVVIENLKSTGGYRKKATVNPWNRKNKQSRQSDIMINMNDNQEIIINVYDNQEIIMNMPPVRRLKVRQGAPENLPVCLTNTKQASDIADALFLKFHSSGVQLVEDNTIHLYSETKNYFQALKHYISQLQIDKENLTEPPEETDYDMPDESGMNHMKVILWGGYFAP